MPKFWNGMSEKEPSGNEIIMVGDPSSSSTPKFALMSKWILFFKNMFYGIFVRFDTSQNLNNTQKQQGRDNLDIYSRDESLQLVDVFATQTATLTENGKGIKNDGTLEVVSARVTKEYDVAGAQQVRINGIAPINHALYVFLDANSNPILPAGEVNNTNAQKSYVAFDVIKPANAERVLICGTLNFGSVCITLTEKYALKSDLDNSVQYTSQTKTDAEKLQARTNINAQENLSTTTLTELNRNYTENGFLLLSDGTTVSATGYHVYSFNVNGKTNVFINGVSVVNAVVECCLACVYNQAGALLQALYIETNQTYTQQEIILATGAYKIKVAGSSAVTARCYEVVQGYPFYTKPESDNTFVKQDGNKVLSDNNFTTALKTLLEKLPTPVSGDEGKALVYRNAVGKFVMEYIQGGSGGGLTQQEVENLILSAISTLNIIQEDEIHGMIEPAYDVVQLEFYQSSVDPALASKDKLWYDTSTNKLKKYIDDIGTTVELQLDYTKIYMCYGMVYTVINNKLVQAASKSYVDSAIAGISIPSTTTRTAILTVAGWSNLSQTINLSGITADNIVTVSPSSSATDRTNYALYGIGCLSQANGTLTFDCKSTPLADINLNIILQ